MPPKVPLLDLTAQFRPIREEILEAIARVCDSQRFILGPEVDALETELAALIGVGHAVALSSGTDALLVALMALDVGPGDEVIVPAYSFFATAGVVSRLGATPVFVDIDRVTFNIDPAQTAAAITPRTRAIMPVHLFGLMADLDPILAAAARAGIPVVEDAAQAIGASRHLRPAGSLGTAGCFSFFPTKNLGAFGEAGLLTSGDEKIARRVRLLRMHGMEPKYIHHEVGGNFRMDALQAAVLRVKAPYLLTWTEARRTNAGRYRALFAEARVPDMVTLPSEPPGYRHIYNQFVIRVPERDALKRHLDAEGIGSEIYYPLALHQQPCFERLGHRAGAFPHAEQAAAQTLALPVYGELTVDQQRVVVAAVAAFVSSRAGAAR